MNLKSLLKKLLKILRRGENLIQQIFLNIKKEINQ